MKKRVLYTANFIIGSMLTALGILMIFGTTGRDQTSALVFTCAAFSLCIQAILLYQSRNEP